MPENKGGGSSFFNKVFARNSFARSEFVMNNYIFFIICRLNSLDIYYF